MKKIFICILTALMIGANLLVLPASVSAAELTASNVSITSNYALVYNLNDDHIMYSKDADAKIYPASMTKMMTALVIVDKIKNKMDDTVTISAEALEGLTEANASVAGFSEFDKETNWDLLYGMLLASGADASKQLAIEAYGSETKLVEAMNKKARSMKLEGTHFVNSTGLHDDDHYSTAMDIMKILKACMSNSIIKKVMSTKNYTTTDGKYEFTDTLYKQEKQAGLVADYIVAGKTGYTPEAGKCLASYNKKNGETYICVVADASKDTNGLEAIKDTVSLMDYYYDNFSRITAYKKGSTMYSVKIKNGRSSSYDITASKDVTVLAPNGTKKKELKTKFEGTSPIDAPVEAKSYLGKLNITLDGAVLKSMPIYANEKIDMGILVGFYYFFRHHMFIIYGLIILLVAFMIKRRMDGSHKSSYGRSSYRRRSKRRYK